MNDLLQSADGNLSEKSKVTAVDSASVHDDGPLRIAVVGAGPAGVYASDILLRQLQQHGEERGLGAAARI
ncbi:MAG: hypothetical protein LKI30_03700, partial [Bifidobacterium crudilactis]|nr:hypothetical protein [Bifidobacterium crudilactis]